MIKRLSERFCIYCYYSCVILDGTITALKSTIGENIILGDLVHVYTHKIPKSQNKLFEIIKIDLVNGISVRDVEDLEKIYLLRTDELVIF
jgi:hypothetical protein